MLLSSADAEQNESGLSLSGSAGGEGGGELSFTETGYPLEWVYLELSKVDSLNRLKLVGLELERRSNKKFNFRI